MTIASLIVDVQAQTSNILQQTKQINLALDSVSKQADLVGDAIGAMGTYLAGSFSIGAVVALAHEVTDFSSHMNDLSAQTGIGVEQLQAFNYAIAGAGLTLEDITIGVSQLSKRLIGDDKSAVGALERLHLSAQALVNDSPDEAITAIVEAVAKLPNPMERSAIMMELFGKSGAQYLRLVNDNLHDLEDQAKQNGAVISRELIEKGDRLDDAWSRVKIQGKALVADVLIPMMDIFNGKMNSDYSILGQIDRFLGGGTAQSLKNIQQTLAAPQFSGPKPLGPLVMSMHDADEVSKSLDASTHELIQREQELAGIRNKAWGLDTIKKVEDTITAIGGVKGVTKLTTDETAAFHKEINAAIDAAEKNGRNVPDSWIRIYMATEQATGSLWDYIQKVSKDLPEAFMKMEKAPLELLGPKSVLEYQRTLTLIAANPPGVVLEGSKNTGLHMGDSMMAGLNSALQQVGPALVSAIEGGGMKLESVFSGMGKGWSTAMFGNAAFQKSITDKFGNSLGGMFNSILPGIGALAGPLITGIGKLFSHIFGESEYQKNLDKMQAANDKFKDSLIATYGSLENIKGMAGGAGDALYHAFEEQGEKGIRDASDAIVNFNKLMKDTQAAVDEFGLTWADLDQAHLPDAMVAQLDKLQTKHDELINAGYSWQAVITKMAGSYSKLAQTAIAGGAQISDKYLEIFQELDGLGLLVDEQGHHYHVMAHDGVLAFQLIADAAKDAGSSAAGAATIAKSAWQAAIDAIDVSKIKNMFNFSYTSGGGSGPQSTSEGRNESHIFDGMSADQAAAVWMSDVASPHSTEQDWNRVKDQYGFAGGTGGAFLDFGRGTSVTLHGRERVMTESEGRNESSLLTEIRGLRRDLPRAMKVGMRDALVLAGVG